MSGRQAAKAVLAAAIVVAAVASMVFMAVRDDPLPAAQAESAESDAPAPTTTADPEVRDPGRIKLTGGAIVAFALPALWIAGFLLTLVRASRRKARGSSDARNRA